jgi:hypothetical protein
VAQVPDFTLVGFSGHDDAVAYLGGVRELLGLLRRHEAPRDVPQVVSMIVETTEEFQAALGAPAAVQVVSVHAGNGAFLSHYGHGVAVNEIRSGARAAVILDCCDGEAMLDGIANQVRHGVVVVAGSSAEQGCSLYPHDSMASFLPVLSELAWEWSGYGREALLRPASVRCAVERAATAVVALRRARQSSSERPVLIARQDEDQMLPGATTFGPR